MSNLRLEIFRLTMKKLESNVENLMLELNILLSKPENVNELVDKVADLTRKISVENNALNQAREFYTQSVGSIVSDLDKLKKEEE